MAAPPPAKPLNAMLSAIPTTIFTVMSALAVEHNSVNLGQGFPDEEGPESMKRVAGESLLKFHNQTLVTVGATEGIAACLMGLLNAGDEVIVFDPCYDSYAPMARMAGATMVPVKLALPDFHVPREELAAAFSSRSKVLLLNSPHNPSGKVFELDELQYIAELCIKHDVIAVCDEVYEHLVFGGRKHVSLRTLPGMKERTIRLGSAGKTFSFTAWKVGWLTGPAPLLAPIVKAHQFLVFTVSSNLQRAVAHGLDQDQDFYHNLGPALERKRALIEPRLQALGFKTMPAHGAYFIVADASAFLKPGETDEGFAKRLTIEAGVTTIPTSGFYLSEERPTHLVRFCYCKDDAKLLAACERLEAYFAGKKDS